MGYHDNCFDKKTFLYSNDEHHNQKRDLLTERAVKRYAETNSEYQKNYEKNYLNKNISKKTSKNSTAIKDTNCTSNNNSSTENHNNNYCTYCEENMAPMSNCSSASSSSDRICPNCRQKFKVKKNGSSSKKNATTSNQKQTQGYKNPDDDFVPSFPPKFPETFNSLIVPGMYTEAERKYYQARQPKLPPVERLTAMLETNASLKQKPKTQYNIITGEELVYPDN